MDAYPTDHPVSYQGEDFASGQVLLFDKPFDWSSFDLVKKVRYLLRKHTGLKLKVGHAGTLDPYATGLMILCTGKFTKKIEGLQGMEKEYEGTIHLGATTPSYDLESEPDQQYPTDQITEALIRQAMQTFVGEQDQVPPIFSAKMVDGKRAYELARAGKPVEMKSNRVHIYSFELLHYHDLKLEFRVRCSKGTYIRSLAHDLGRALNSGAYLARLCRTAIGPYRLEQALQVQEFEQKLSAASAG